MRVAGAHRGAGARRKRRHERNARAVTLQQTAVEARPAAPQVEPFDDRLWREAEDKQSWVCLGLDVDLARLPEHLPKSVDGARRFLQEVVDACAASVAAFKPNLAFYLALEGDGLALLRELRRMIDDRAVLLVDCKVGDVLETSQRYARFLFDDLGADAVTFNAWLGRDAVEPLIERPERGAFACVRTSNPDADDVQGFADRDGQPAYEHMARLVETWNTRRNLGVVAGATRPSDVRRVRAAAPGAPMLAPGVGAQGGMLAETVQAGFGAAPAGVLVNAGRSALWAGDGEDFAERTRAEVEAMRRAIEKARRPVRARG